MRAQKQFDINSKCFKKIYTQYQKNVIITGGCGLNVVFNYVLRKSLPSDINLYVDPLCGDIQ